MATNLVAVGNQAPGFYGLNLQQSSTVLDPQWASEANNAVITSDGRVGARMGFVKKSTIAGTIRTLHEVITTTGTSAMVAATDSKIYYAVAPYTTFTNIYSTTITNNNWQMTNFNGHVYMFQNGEFPLVYDVTSGVIEKLSAHTTHGAFTDSSDAVIATIKPDCVHSAFGRLWVGGSSTPANGSKIWWCDSLNAENWGGGSAGALDLQTVLTGGTDYVTAISSFQDYLIIFCKNSILMYSGANSTPSSNLLLVEHIRGIGCIARDSVRNIGTDILFLSSSGVKSFNRIVQEKSAPIRDVSQNVRDYLGAFSQAATVANIKSTYNPHEGFYLLSFPDNNKVFCFDLRAPLPDGSARATTWDGINPTAMVTLSNYSTYFGRTTDVGLYDSYVDDGSSYTFTYSTPWLDYGQEFNIKMLKNFYILGEAGNSKNITISWATDFKESYSSVTKTSDASGTVAEYSTVVGVAGQYGISEYGYGYNISTLQGTLSKSGKTVKMKVTVPVDSRFNMKKYEIYAKVGRIV